MLKKIIYDNNKNLPMNKSVVEILNLKYIYIPLINNNIKCDSVVNINKKVKIGEVVGLRKDINFPICSSVSGVVKGIEKKRYLDNSFIDCIKIENDFKEEYVSNIEYDIYNYNKSDFLNLLKVCSVSGMGGADFPTYLKYEKKIKYLIVNATECEPFVSSDYSIMKIKFKEILDCVDAIKKINKIEKCIVVVNSEYKDVINMFNHIILNYKNIQIKKVYNRYPVGYEKVLIKRFLNIDYDNYPIEKNVVVNNVSTIYSIYNALKYRRFDDKRIISLNGSLFKKPQNYIVKIGSSIEDVLSFTSGFKDLKTLKLVSCGPMMGSIITQKDLIVTKNLSSLLFMKNDKKEIEKTCMRCGKCEAVCIAKLPLVYIKEHVNNKLILKDLNVKSCVDCGLCSYICPAKIDVRKYINVAKNEVKEYENR